MSKSYILQLCYKSKFHQMFLICDKCPQGLMNNYKASSYLPFQYKEHNSNREADNRDGTSNVGDDL